MEYFGQPDRIWESKLSKIKNTLGGDSRTCWGSIKSQKRVMAISHLVEFLKEAEKMAKTYKELDREIYHSTTFKLIFNFIPVDIQLRFNRNVSGPSLDYKDKFTGLATFLESERENAMEDLRNSNNDDTKEKNHTVHIKGTITKCIMLMVMIPIMIMAVNIAMASRAS